MVIQWQCCIRLCAVGNMYDPMYKFSSIPKAAAASMMAGTDMNCGTAYTNGLSDAIKSKLLDVSF